MENGNKSTFFFRITELQTLYLSLTAIFLCTGFFCNFIFFRLFGIRAVLFSTLQDYLSSSIPSLSSLRSVAIAWNLAIFDNNMKAPVYHSQRRLS